MAGHPLAPRGRPRKNNNIIEINNIRLEFIITKTDNYENDISYLKVIDKQFKSKLQPILSQTCDEVRLPIWKSDDGFYMLKVKRKWMPEHEFENNEILTADLNFHYFNMAIDDGVFTDETARLLQGYYVKLSTNDVVFDSVYCFIKKIYLLIYK
jgi:hypothetical protein